jgi:hypothetical protein
MSNGTGSPPPLGSHPNGIDITDPKYAYNTEDWIKTPGQFDHALTSESLMTSRKDNGSTWERYITFGYHVYDYCFQFETQWERMRENEMDVLTFVWHVYFYRVNRALDMPRSPCPWFHFLRTHFGFSRLTYSASDLQSITTYCISWRSSSTSCCNTVDD